MLPDLLLSLCGFEIKRIEGPTSLWLSFKVETWLRDVPHLALSRTHSNTVCEHVTAVWFHANPMKFPVRKLGVDYLAVGL